MATPLMKSMYNKPETVILLLGWPSLLLTCWKRHHRQQDNQDVLSQSNGPGQQYRGCYRGCRTPGWWRRPEASATSLWKAPEKIGIAIWIHLANRLRGMKMLLFCGYKQVLFSRGLAGSSSYGNTIGHWYETLRCGSTTYQVRPGSSITVSWYDWSRPAPRV